jgi:tellurite resistance protein TerC
MILEYPLKAIGFQPVYSIYIIISILATSITLSLLFPKKEKEESVDTKILSEEKKSADL